MDTKQREHFCKVLVEAIHHSNVMSEIIAYIKYSLGAPPQKHELDLIFGLLAGKNSSLISKATLCEGEKQ